MEVKDIIDRLQMAKAECEWNYPIDYYIAFDEAVKLLEKQVLREPKMGSFYKGCDCYEFFEMICPTCNSNIGAYEINLKAVTKKCGNYCPNCGQAIIWL